MIARCLLLLVAAVVLLVHNHQAKILDRRKDSGTSAYHHARLAIANAAPLFRAFRVSKCGMQYGNLLSKAMEKLASHGRR